MVRLLLVENDEDDEDYEEEDDAKNCGTLQSNIFIVKP